jgi:hypothetical protein
MDPTLHDFAGRGEQLRRLLRPIQSFLFSNEDLSVSVRHGVTHVLKELQEIAGETADCGVS